MRACGGGGGGGVARLGPTADGRGVGGGGVGRCAPIWVLVNPLALVRDDQSPTASIRSSNNPVTVIDYANSTITITLTITTNAKRCRLCSSLTTANGFMRTQIVSHRRGRVAFTSVSERLGAWQIVGILRVGMRTGCRNTPRTYDRRGWGGAIVIHHGPMTGGGVSKEDKSASGLMLRRTPDMPDEWPPYERYPGTFFLRENTRCVVWACERVEMRVSHAQCVRLERPWKCAEQINKFEWSYCSKNELKPPPPPVNNRDHPPSSAISRSPGWILFPAVTGQRGPVIFRLHCWQPYPQLWGFWATCALLNFYSCIGHKLDVQPSLLYRKTVTELDEFCGRGLQWESSWLVMNSINSTSHWAAFQIGLFSPLFFFSVARADRGGSSSFSYSLHSTNTYGPNTFQKIQVKTVLSGRAPLSITLRMWKWSREIQSIMGIRKV